MNQSYQNGQWQQYPNTPQQSEKMGFSIASLVMGILSVLCCWIYGGFLGLIGVVLGIVALTKKESKKGMAIAGIITSVFGIIILVFLLIATVFASAGKLALSDPQMQEEILDLVDEYGDGDYEYDYDSDNELTTQDPFAGKRYKAGDDSVIYFEEDGTYIWYQDDTDHSDNYYAGRYEAYVADDAEDYIVNDLSEYAFTQEEMDDYFARNADSDLFQKENMVCFVLYAEERIVEGEDVTDDAEATTPYMGFLKDGYLDAANMKTLNYVIFTECE